MNCVGVIFDFKFDMVMSAYMNRENNYELWKIIMLDYDDVKLTPSGRWVDRLPICMNG